MNKNTQEDLQDSADFIARNGPSPERGRGVLQLAMPLRSAQHVAVEAGPSEGPSRALYCPVRLPIYPVYILLISLLMKSSKYVPRLAIPQATRGDRRPVSRPSATALM